MAAAIQTNTSHMSPTKLFTPAVVMLLILTTSGFILALAAPDFSASVFAVSSRGIVKARLWQLVTYPFIDTRPMNLVFSALMVLFVGSAIEREWRTASFLMLWLVVSVACGLLWVLITSVLGGNYTGAGAGACTYGLIATFGLLNRGKRILVFFAMMEAQYLVIILIVLGIILNLAQPIGLIWILGAPVAYFYVKLRWRLAERSVSQSRKSADSERGRFVDID